MLFFDNIMFVENDFVNDGEVVEVGFISTPSVRTLYRSMVIIKKRKLL